MKRMVRKIGALIAAVSLLLCMAPPIIGSAEIVGEPLEFNKEYFFDKYGDYYYDFSVDKIEHLTIFTEGGFKNCYFYLVQSPDKRYYAVGNSSVNQKGTYSKTFIVMPGNYQLHYYNSSGSESKMVVTYEVSNGVPMYRLYNKNSGEHFYTAKEEEKTSLSVSGWAYEGIGWTAPEGGIPVYRLYNKNAGDHHYTTNPSERANLVAVGWKDEGIGWYSADTDGVPLYRQYNPNAKTGTHNYTTDKTENDALVKMGWKDEGIGWYGLK